MFESKINRGRANGYAPLNGDGKVGLNYLPDVVGVAGTSGTSGVNGVNGSQGSSGANGTNGLNGTNGTSGTSPFAEVDTGSFATTGSNTFTGVQTLAGTSGTSWAELTIGQTDIFGNYNSYDIRATGSSAAGISLTSDIVSVVGVVDKDFGPAGNNSVVFSGKYGFPYSDGPFTGIGILQSGSEEKVWIYDYKGISAFPGDVNIGYTGFIAGEYSGSLNVNKGNINVSGSINTTGSLNISTGSVNIKNGNINVSGSINTTGSLNIISGSLNVKGNSSFTGNINLSGSLNISSSMIISSTVVNNGSINALNSDLIIDGGDIILSGSQYISGSLNVDGDINISGSVNMIGDQTITGSLAINDVSTNFLIEGNGFGQAYLTAGGAIVLNPGYGGVEMTGANRSFKATDITADGTLLVKGSTTLGDNGADNTTITGSFLVSGSTTQIGSNTLIGNTVLSGSVSISGSTIQYGNNTIQGNNTITGNTVMSGSINVSGSFTGSMQIDGDLNLQSPHSFYRWGNKLFNYGAFSDTTIQSASVAQENTELLMRFNTTDIGGNGVYIQSGSRAYVENTGIYNIQFSAQFDRFSSSGIKVLSIWLKKDGNNVPNSCTDIVVSGGASEGAVVAAWNFVYPIEAGHYVELAWSTPDHNIGISSFTTRTSPIRPAVPSIILTVTQVA